jgi:virulence-associated protein VapD
MNKKEIINFLENATIQKDKEDKSKFICFGDVLDNNEDLKKILFDAGFKIMDFYYNTLDNAFNDIANYLESHDLEDLKNDFEVYDYAEADVYNTDLLKWVYSDLNNINYCNDVINEYELTDFIQILQYAQSKQKDEIYYMALELIKYLIEDEKED